MGPIGWPEMMCIALLALVLFGPKKLGEIGRTAGKALAEFQRLKREWKATLDRESAALMREPEALTSPANRSGEQSRYISEPYGSFPSAQPEAPDWS